MAELELKKELLNSIITKSLDAPVQRSHAWYEIRETSIGGSEIACVLGVNPFKTMDSLLLDKLGVGQKFTGNIATRWGTLFENITGLWVKTIMHFETDLIEIGSIEGSIKGQRYSPDGLAVIRNTNGTYSYVLFEFKSPLNSLPTKTIPKHYVPQVQTGLLTIPEADYAIFVNNSYRKCELKDLNFTTNYDFEFHSSDFKKLKNGLKNTPLAIGIVLFYKSTNEIIKGNYIDYGKSRGDIDYGSSSEDIEYLFEQISEGNIQYDVSFIQTIQGTYDFANYIIKSEEKLNSYNKNLIGIMPWKLMRSNVIKEERDPNWRSVIEKPVEQFISILENYRKELSNNSIKEDDIKALNNDNDFSNDDFTSMQGFIQDTDDISID